MERILSDEGAGGVKGLKVFGIERCVNIRRLSSRWAFRSAEQYIASTISPPLERQTGRYPAYLLQLYA